MIDDLTVATPSLPGNHGVWFNDGDTIPYLMRFRAKQARPLSRAELARFAAGPVIR